MGKRGILLVAIVTVIGTVIGGLILAFTIAYITTPTPDIDVALGLSWCDGYIEFPDFNKFEFGLKNAEESDAFVKVCFNSEDLIFKTNNDLTNDFCFKETSIPKKSIEKYQPFTVTIDKLKEGVKEGDNVTINIDIECNQKIWNKVNKACKKISYPCLYRVDGKSLRIIKNRY